MMCLLLRGDSLKWHSRVTSGTQLQGLVWKDRYDGQWHVERKVVEGRTGDTKTAAGQEGVPIILFLQKITNKYWKRSGCPRKDRSPADG
jgi:hypothetical protein